MLIRSADGIMRDMMAEDMRRAKGDEIPISAQVVSLADVYDALVGERVYKKAYSHEKAVQMILNGECGAFNPILLECLLDIQDR